MRTRSRRRLGWATAAALAFVVGAPGLAHAQQSGMFPLAPIKRERVPCELENPAFKLYRHQYFGYHPTCWQKFPAGWGCASPEAPNAARAFADLPRDPVDIEPGPGPGDEQPGDMPGPRGPAQPPPGLPPLPSGDSPFNTDPRPNTPPAGGNRPTTDDPRGEGLGARDPAPSSEGAPLPAPRPPATTTSPRDNDSILGLPDPTVYVPNVPPNSGNDPSGTGFPMAPKRQSLLGNLFGGLLRR